MLQRPELEANACDVSVERRTALLKPPGALSFFYSFRTSST